MSGTVPAVVDASVTPPTNPYVTPDLFRVDFTQFEDATKYPDAQVQRFLDIAGVMINPGRWGRMTTFAMELVAAHFLTMQAYFIARAAGTPFPPGIGVGLMQSKSVSKVSVGYDYNLTSVEGGGPWNWTVYGEQYLWWARLAGTGGYETLALTSTPDFSGTVLTWERGVFERWGS